MRIIGTQPALILMVLACIAGCTRTMRVDDYVPAAWSEMEGWGMFDVSPSDVGVAFERREIPKGWHLLESQVLFVRNSRGYPGLSAWIGLPDTSQQLTKVGYTYPTISFNIAPVLVDGDEFFEILIETQAFGSVPRYPWGPIYHGAALVHASSHDDARIVDSGKRPTRRMKEAVMSPAFQKLAEYW